jgi:hypothetical protein
MFRHAVKRAAIYRPTISKAVSVHSQHQAHQAWLVFRGSQGRFVWNWGVAHNTISRLKTQPPTSTPISLGNETIYALSSGAGRAGIAVIRISGPGCLDVKRPLSVYLYLLHKSATNKFQGLQWTMSHKASTKAETRRRQDPERARLLA